MPPKRKRSSVAADAVVSGSSNGAILPPPPPKRQASRRASAKIDTNPDHNAEILDGKTALRASPDADERGESLDVKAIAPIVPTITPAKPATKAKAANGKGKPKQEEDSDSLLSDLESSPAKKPKKTPTKSSIAAKKGSNEIKAFKAEQAAKKAAEKTNGVKAKKEDEEDEWDKRQDPDGDEEGPVEDVDVLKKEAARAPPVNSDFLPLPWRGRLGYACLNTYLRFSNLPIFCSRTCRIASILEHRHPLADPSQPEHATKNRPDKTKPASIQRGQKYVEDICLANIRDLPKMLRWNDKYGIKFMRLSSEMFPFASHLEYGYKLAPFAAEPLAEVGKVIAALGHRVSTHPGQFTQLGSPRQEVINNAVRDLEYHDEMLSLLKLPEQDDRDAVMILHMGGTFGDKEATLNRFRENYKGLSDSIKMRLVLENDDVSWSVHDLLPICEELSIPLCLDFHHHNIIFDPSQLREGTLDIMQLYPRIKATWEKKRIKQKMHYSEPCPEAITGRQRRKHNPRPQTMPPCPADMDLMIEAKDKEQAVFELMRTLKLPGWDLANTVIPFERSDDNRPIPRKAKKKKTKMQIKAEIEEFGVELDETADEPPQVVVADEDVGMGGPENRVYWPVGMEEWLRPKKREIKKKGGDAEDEEAMFKNPTPANFEARKKILARNKAPLNDEMLGKLTEAKSVGDLKNILEEVQQIVREAEAAADGDDDTEVKKEVKSKTPAKVKAAAVKKEAIVKLEAPESKSNGKAPAKKAPAKKTAPKKKAVKQEEAEDEEEAQDEDDDEDLSMPDLSDGQDEVDRKIRTAAPRPGVGKRASGRGAKGRVSYAEKEEEEDVDME